MDDDLYITLLNNEGKPVKVLNPDAKNLDDDTRQRRRFLRDFCLMTQAQRNEIQELGKDPGINDFKKVQFKVGEKLKVGERFWVVNAKRRLVSVEEMTLQNTSKKKFVHDYPFHKNPHYETVEEREFTFSSYNDCGDPVDTILWAEKRVDQTNDGEVLSSHEGFYPVNYYVFRHHKNALRCVEYFMDRIQKNEEF